MCIHSLTHTAICCGQELHLPVFVVPNSPISPGAGPPRPEGQREGHRQQIAQSSQSLGFWGNSGGHMLGGVARPWQGGEMIGQLRGSPAGRVLWAGSLVTHGFWETAGHTGDLLCL